MTVAILAAQAVASAAMAGIVWFVQLVHYPLLARLPAAGSADWCAENRRITPRVVLPPMLVEAGAAVWLAAAPPPAVGRPAALVGLALVAVAWASTLLVQMPLHARLGREGPTAATVTALVRSNWLRTAAWTARAAVAAWMLRVG
jgi:hypothetical protein